MSELGKGHDREVAPIQISGMPGVNSESRVAQKAEDTGEVLGTIRSDNAWVYHLLLLELLAANMKGLQVDWKNSERLWLMLFSDAACGGVLYASFPLLQNTRIGTQPLHLSITWEFCSPTK